MRDDTGLDVGRAERLEQGIDVVEGFELAELGVVVSDNSGGDDEGGVLLELRAGAEAAQELVEVVVVVGGELGDGLLELVEDVFFGQVEARFDQGAYGIAPCARAESGGGEEGVIEVEQDGPQASHAGRVAAAVRRP